MMICILKPLFLFPVIFLFHVSLCDGAVTGFDVMTSGECPVTSDSNGIADSTETQGSAKTHDSAENIDTTRNTVSLSLPAVQPVPVTLERTGRNAVYVELLGSGINLYSLNYERSVRNNLHARIGGSWIGYSDQLKYENRGEDIFFNMYTVPAVLGMTLFGGINQLELGMGATFFWMSFDGGPYDLGYNDIELGKRYTGLAITSVIGYRVSVHDYLFRIGISPHYMLTIESELSGFFTELKERGALDVHDYLDLSGFRIIPGISFGRTF